MESEVETFKIPLDKGFSVLVDKEDFEKFGHIKWHAHYDNHSRKFYAMHKNLRLHRMILGLTDPKIFADHINHDPLDCRKRNLRPVTIAQNNRNLSGARKHSSSGIRGVVRVVGSKSTWRADIRLNGKKYYLGTFPTAEAATVAYREANKKLFGEYGGL